MPDSAKDKRYSPDQAMATAAALSSADQVFLKKLDTNTNFDIRATAPNVKLSGSHRIYHGEKGRLFKKAKNRYDEQLTQEWQIYKKLNKYQGTLFPVVEKHLYIDDQHWTYLAMEHVEGKTLESVTKGLPSQHFLHVVAKLVEGLKALKEFKLIHRDLHGGNIIYNQCTGRVAIIDTELCIDLESLKTGDPVQRKGHVDYSPANLTWLTEEEKDRLETAIDFRDRFALRCIIESYLRQHSEALRQTEPITNAVTPVQRESCHSDRQEPADDNIIKKAHIDELKAIASDLADVGAYLDPDGEPRSLDFILRRVVRAAYPLYPKLLADPAPPTLPGTACVSAEQADAEANKPQAQQLPAGVTRRRFMGIAAGVGMPYVAYLGFQWQQDKTRLALELAFSDARFYFERGIKFNDELKLGLESSTPLVYAAISELKGVDGKKTSPKYFRKEYLNAAISCIDRIAPPGSKLTLSDRAQLWGECARQYDPSHKSLAFLGKLFGSYFDCLPNEETDRNVCKEYSLAFRKDSLDILKSPNKNLADDAANKGIDDIKEAIVLKIDLALAYKNTLKKESPNEVLDEARVDSCLKDWQSAIEFLLDAFAKLSPPTESENTRLDSAFVDWQKAQVAYYGGWLLFDPRMNGGQWLFNKYNKKIIAEKKVPANDPVFNSLQEKIDIVKKLVTESLKEGTVESVYPGKYQQWCIGIDNINKEFNPQDKLWLLLKKQLNVKDDSIKNNFPEACGILISKIISQNHAMVDSKHIVVNFNVTESVANLCVAIAGFCNDIVDNDKYLPVIYLLLLRASKIGTQSETIAQVQNRFFNNLIGLRQNRDDKEDEENKKDLKMRYLNQDKQPREDAFWYAWNCLEI